MPSQRCRLDAEVAGVDVWCGRGTWTRTSTRRSTVRNARNRGRFFAYFSLWILAGPGWIDHRRWKGDPATAPARRHVPSRGGEPRPQSASRALLAEPGFPLVGVGVEPLLGRVFGFHVLLGDVPGDLVLVVVGPREVLHHRHRRAARIGELLGHHLVQLVIRIATGDL